MDERHASSTMEASTVDLERNDGSEFLMNHSVHDFAWSGLTVTVRDRQTKKARDLINDITADVQQGTCTFSSLL